jgi:hypothetical protein
MHLGWGIASEKVFFPYTPLIRQTLNLLYPDAPPLSKHMDDEGKTNTKKGITATCDASFL